MEKTIIAGYIEIGCAFTPVIIMAIYGILNKDRDVKHPFMALLIWIFAIGLPLWSIACYLDTPTKAKATYTDKVHQIYNNKIDAKVSYYADGRTFSGDEQLSDLLNHTIPEHYDHKLVITKNKETVTKKVKVYEVHGDKTDKVYKIEYGTRHYQVKHFGIVLATGEEPVIKIYTKPTNEADRQAIENLLKGND